LKLSNEFVGVVTEIPKVNGSFFEIIFLKISLKNNFMHQCQ
jgi:hypothetical protein